MSDLSSSQCGRHVLSAWSGRVQLSKQLFLWKSRHKLSLSLRKILEVRFHKQLHDYKELQLSSRPGIILLSNFGFICTPCKVSWSPGLDYHCLTARSLEAECFRMWISTNKIYRTSFPKLGLKTVNAVPVKNRCFFFSISLKPAAWTLFFYDLALSSESSDQGPIATLSGINRSFINTVLNNITMSSHGT